MPQPDHITRLDLPDRTVGDAELEAYFQTCAEKLGLVPNVLRAYTGNPAKLRAFISMYNTLMLGPSGLSKLEREMIAVVVSNANHCYYCLVAHGQAVRALSDDPQLGEMMALNYRVAELTPRQRAMLDVAWPLTVAPHDVGEAERQRLREAGLSEDEVFDVFDVAAFFNYTNRIAHGLDMIPNADYHAMNR
ncbi:peroxidase-related enzyme [Roseospira marina]|uniref:Peroxidase-related enzyme n=1 Tax=Roseospira marina TaxID=140057 RepID=A0A5M6IHV6_9PROT|nr:peroxidase-related enzyme [Roseospira marina]KAA5607225.1 peroxidase-related enzyme [Roseospira marina]MBB4312624.1 putative peroxidase-related enzyme [Roseospira marina]MBB5085360.1 putative peroxidase-related enzyme [Roseospira marina]